VTNFLSAAKQLGHDFDAYAMQMTTNGNNNHNNNKVKILFGQKGEMPRERETGSVNGPVSKTSALSCDNFLVEFRSNT